MKTRRLIKMLNSIILPLLFVSGNIAVSEAQISVQGRHLVNHCGQRIVFRGIEHMIFPFDQQGSFIPEVGKTGANAIRIVMSPTATNGTLLRSLLQKAVDQNKMYVSVCIWDDDSFPDWWNRSDIKSVLLEYENYITISAYGEAEFHNDQNRWVSEAKAIIQRIRGYGFKCPLEIFSTTGGRDPRPILDRGLEVFNSDPLRNILFGCQLYWGSFYEGEYGMTKAQATDRFAALNFPVQVGACRSDCEYNCGRVAWDEAVKKDLNVMWWSWSGDEFSLSNNGMANNLTADGQYIVNSSQYSISKTSTKPSCNPSPSGNIAAAGTIIATVRNPVGGGGNKNIEIIRDGTKPALGSTSDTQQFDTFDQDAEPYQEHIGYTFSQPYSFTSLVFQEGKHFNDGGFFANGSLKVQVRNGTTWTNVNVPPAPTYPVSNNWSDFGQSYQTYTFNLPNVVGTGIRIFGDAGGSAHFISVGELEVYGTPIANPVTSKYEAEDGTVATFNGGGIASDHAGYSGGGFWAYVNTPGFYIRFTVNASSAGNKNVTCRYANGMGNNRTLSLYVNGAYQRAVTFTPLSNWSTWNNKVEAVALNAGNNTIEFRYNNSDNGNINLDYIELTNTGARQQTEIEAQVNESVQVYPNPATGNTLTVIIKAAEKTVASIQLFSPTSQQVIDLQRPLEKGDNTVQISTEHLTKGLHLLIIQKGRERIVKKVIVDK